MQLEKIFEFIVREGKRAELRSPRQLKRGLQLLTDERRSLRKSDKAFFDNDRLTNPYSDTRIVFGDPRTEVRKVMVGIDIDVGEILLTDRLRRNGEKIDLIISHHPLGVGLGGLAEVMDMQVDFLESLGIKLPIAQDFLLKRKEEVSRRLQSANIQRSVDAARWLNIPLLCCHTPADNHVTRYLTEKIQQQKPKTLKELLELLLGEPEYQEAQRNKIGPQIYVGKGEDKVGRFMVDMTGGTEGSKDVYPRLSQCGIDTLLTMHLSEGHLSRIKTEHVNVVNAGHIASDNLGMNLLFDKLERQADFDWLECSGFRRVRRPWRLSQKR